MLAQSIFGRFRACDECVPLTISHRAIVALGLESPRIDIDPHQSSQAPSNDVFYLVDQTLTLENLLFSFHQTNRPMAVKIQKVTAPIHSNRIQSSRPLRDRAEFERTVAYGLPYHVSAGPTSPNRPALPTPLRTPPFSPILQINNHDHGQELSTKDRSHITQLQ